MCRSRTVCEMNLRAKLGLRRAQPEDYTYTYIPRFPRDTRGRRGSAYRMPLNPHSGTDGAPGNRSGDLRCPVKPTRAQVALKWTLVWVFGCLGLLGAWGMTLGA